MARRWERRSPAERRRVVDALPSEFEKWLYLPEGDQHYNTQMRIRSTLDDFFARPYLLWFVAEDPVRNDKLPGNIAQVARAIITAAERQRVESLQEQLDYALRHKNRARKDHYNLARLQESLPQAVAHLVQRSDLAVQFHDLLLQP